MTQKKVSIIIPTYKRADKIERAILSILNQTYGNYEIIIVDDNGEDSEDSSLLEEKLKKYIKNNNVILLKHKKNMNGAAARNTGISKAIGDYITFLDDDDYFLPNRLEVLVNELENNPQYDAAYSGCIKIYKNSIIKIFNATKSGNLKLDILAQKSFYGTGSNMFFRNEAIKKVGKFDTSFYRHQDFEYMVRFFRYFKILNIETMTVVKKFEDKLNVPNLEKSIQIREKYLKTFEDDIKKYNENEQKYIYSNNLSDLLIIAIKNNDNKAVKKIIKDYRIKYGDLARLSLKQKIKIMIYYINNIIPVEKCLYFIMGIINQLKIDKKIKNEIKILEEKNDINNI